MTGSTTAASLDLTEGLRRRLAEASLPAPTHAETELQRLASRRLGRATDGSRTSDMQTGSRSVRVRMQRKQSTPGAFDSPQGFVYVSEAVSHKRA